MWLHYPVQIYKKYAYTSTCTFEQIADVTSYVEMAQLCSMCPNDIKNSVFICEKFGVSCLTANVWPRTEL